jgi:hypothetical protein
MPNELREKEQIRFSKKASYKQQEQTDKKCENKDIYQLFSKILGESVPEDESGSETESQM